MYVGRFDLAEFAVVLEPDEPLLKARRTFYAGMAALADALAAHAQPETSIVVDWPDSIFVNGGLVGGGRLAWPEDTREIDTPPWLVFAGMIRTVSMTGTEPGLNPLVTALEEVPPKRPTSLGAVLNRIASQIHRKSLVVVISDIFDDVDGVQAGLRRLRHRGNEVIIFHVLADDEVI